MQRLKKPFVWLTLLSLIISLLPPGLATVAQAATTSPPSYFIPNNAAIRDSFGLTTEYGTDQITRDNVFHVTTSTLTFDGVFSKVSSNNMTVKVERLNATPHKDSTGNDTGDMDWVPDTTSVYYNNVSLDSSDGTGNKFIVRDLTLFAGFNKITLSGVQGGVTQSDSFYVLYDKVPYLEELKMYDGGAQAKFLNEGTPVVTNTSTGTIALEGTAKNTTKVTLTINGTATSTLPMDEYTGKFYSSGVVLSPGTNDLKLIITNGADTITLHRTVFYYTDNQRLTSLYVYDGSSKPVSALGVTPTLTQALTGGKLITQVLIPYKENNQANEGSFGSPDFKGKISYKLSSAADTDPYTDFSSFTVLKSNFIKEDGTLNTDVGTEVIVPDASGNPEYLLVTLMTDLPSTDPGLNQFKLRIQYGDAAAPRFTATTNVSYKYLQGQALITNMYLLSNYEKDSTNSSKTNINDYAKETLNGSTVNSGTFYVLIESNQAPGSNILADYLPLGSKDLKITPVAPTVSTAVTQRVYKIEDFSTGQQKVRFWYAAGEYKDATISYITMNKISFTNLIYGQTYPVNSKVNSTLNLKVEGQYIGFENFSTANAEYFVNGVKGTTAPTWNGNSFSINLAIGTSGPLYYGENRITFTGTSRDGNGNARVVTGEMLIYIVDENGATISYMQPTPSVVAPASLPGAGLYQQILYPSGGTVDPTAKAEFDEIITNLFALSPTFTYDATANKYTTNQKQFNIIMRGSGATKASLFFGSQSLFSVNLSETTATEGDGTFNYDFGSGAKTYSYSYVGSEKDFIIRVYNVDMEVPGSYNFNLELVNNTGSRTNKKLEVERVVEAYRLLAPTPTVGDKYIVNKNFVHFDIEAEGATKVLIDKYEATPRQEAGMKDRFVYDYVGLKPDKSTKIKIQIVRSDATFNDTIEVYYTSSITVDSQYMAEKVSNKYSIFNKSIELSFPKGTVLQSANPGLNATQFYPDNKILFGIADPVNGVVGKRDDYGNYIGRAQEYLESGLPQITIPAELSSKFSRTESRSNFTPISNIYWISGGVGESNVGGVYKSATNGIAPYSLEGFFTMFTSDRKIVPSQRGELTLAYDKNVVDEAGTTITVFRFNDRGIWENIGGEVDTKKHTITVPFDDFGYYSVMKLRRSYSDVTNHGWARNILNALYSKGIMKNLRGDSFGTDDRVSRGEFATLLVRGLDLPLNYPKDGDHSKSSFLDIGPGAQTETWSYEYIETAARAGIVTGVTEGVFSPYTPITREQAAVMISRALKLKLAANDDKLNAALAKSFIDSGSMDYYSRPAIQAVSKAKIMSGAASTLPGQKKPSYSFNPKGYMTRAEAGKIAVELFKKSTSLFPKNFN
ncbi:Endoglucanase precursor [compost metagenome]